MKTKITKPLYRIRNWKQYNSALVNRGSLTLWFDQDSIKSWVDHSRSGKRGRPRDYSDACVLSMLVLKTVYRLPQRATAGLVCSVMRLMKLNLPVPHHTILSRRAANLQVRLPRKPKDEALHLIVDATGLKVYGEGEWKVRQHGYGKRRTWRKLHIAIDESTGEVVAAVATRGWESDKAQLAGLLDQVEQTVDRVTGDGGYDYADCYQAIATIGARAVIPPRRTGRVHVRDERLAERNKALRVIRKIGRKKWKRRVRYHRRSLVETAMMRLKKIFGEGLSGRGFGSQETEMRVRCAVLNRMTGLGMPDSYAI